MFPVVDRGDGHAQRLGGMRVAFSILDDQANRIAFIRTQLIERIIDLEVLRLVFHRCA